MIKVLVTGAGGQLAWELAQSAPAPIEVVCLSEEQLDITVEADCVECINHHRPDWLVNAAAYTAVDGAEHDSRNASAVNEEGARFLARSCTRFGARMVQVSTDFVFEGTANTPYPVDAVPNPRTVYGVTKLAGERAVLEELPQAVIVRTAWLYSAHGNNFVKTMLALMAKKPQLGVVVDQVSTPTWARGLAQAIWTGVQRNVVGGVYHWSDAGVASWYDFAVTIQDIALELGLLRDAIPVRPVPTSEFPTPAKRPAYSVLDKRSTEAAFGLEAVHWRRQLKSMLETLA